MLLSSIRFALVMVLGCGVAHPLLATAVGRAVGSRLVSQDIPPELVAAWRADSELSRVRAADGPLVLSEATFAVIREALELAEATGGPFDPTVQPLVELWGIHGERRMDLPSDELAAARARLDWTLPHRVRERHLDGRELPVLPRRREARLGAGGADRRGARGRERLAERLLGSTSTVHQDGSSPTCWLTLP